jgi:hypothetical protein
LQNFTWRTNGGNSGPAYFAPYALTAHTAAQDITQPNILELKEVKARVELRDGQHLTREAGVVRDEDRGIGGTGISVRYRGSRYQKRGFEIERSIVLHSTSGYDGYLSEATVYVTPATWFPKVQWR